MALFVVGDVHGQLAKLTRLLHHSGMIDSEGVWAGSTATLCFVGDFVDRGPAGIAVIDLVMRLQREATSAGGQVIALLGNHDALILAAHRLGKRPTTGPRGTFVSDWRHHGGVEADLAGLGAHHAAWLETLPAMVLLGGYLFVHADSPFYLTYGRTLDAVNAAVNALLQSDDVQAWDTLLADFGAHRGFGGKRGDRQAEELLRTFGGRQLIHGHTPISNVSQQEPEGVTAPLIYARRRCINVDGGMYLGGPGFIYELAEQHTRAHYD